MSINGKFKLTMPNEVLAEMTIKATVGEWRELRNLLKDVSRWPACDFAGLMDDLLAQADKAWWQTSDNLKDKPS